MRDIRNVHCRRLRPQNRIDLSTALDRLAQKLLPVADKKPCFHTRRTLPAKSPELTDNRIFARGQTIHRRLRNGFFKVSYTL